MIRSYQRIEFEALEHDGVPLGFHVPHHERVPHRRTLPCQSPECFLGVFHHGDTSSRSIDSSAHDRHSKEIINSEIVSADAKVGARAGSATNLDAAIVSDDYFITLLLR
jgi:hypothetical protein